MWRKDCTTAGGLLILGLAVDHVEVMFPVRVLDQAVV